MLSMAMVEGLEVVRMGDVKIDGDAILMICSNVADLNETFRGPILWWLEVLACFRFHRCLDLEKSKAGDSPKSSLEYRPSIDKLGQTDIES
jgi:hypothetical protein